MKRFTPKLAILGIVVLLGIGAVYIAATRNSDSLNSLPQSSDPSTLASKAESSIGEFYDGSAGAIATPSATPISTPPSITTYTYPGSRAIKTDSAKLELESQDEVQRITDWYKNKIAELNFNAKSLAQTSTNGEVFNKLSAAKPGEKIEVSIKKDQTASSVLITVDRF